MNRIRLLLLALVLVACAPPQTLAGPSPRETNVPANRLSVLNPVGKPPPIPLKAMAPRYDALDGRTVYLVDVRFMNGDRFLRQMQNWFSEHRPRVKTVFMQKEGAYGFDDTALWERVKAEKAVVIMAIGH